MSKRDKRIHKMMQAEQRAYKIKPVGHSIGYLLVQLLCLVFGE